MVESTLAVTGFLCVDALAGDEWEISEQLNSDQGFYQLPNLKPGTEYRLQVVLNNATYWENEVLTSGPGTLINTDAAVLLCQHRFRDSSHTQLSCCVNTGSEIPHTLSCP